MSTVNNATAFPFARPIYVTLKPVGPQCNMHCDYCYYADKAGLYRQEETQTMSIGLVEEFTRQYISSQTARQVLFIWHGGEPMLRPLSFYRRAVELQQRYAAGRHIDNFIQTNGTLIDDEWCRFLRDHHWLVGISIDGTQAMHDAYRRTRGGGATWRQVMKAIDRLKHYGVDWNVMATINACNVTQPEQFYSFIQSVDARYIQFTPIVERRQDIDMPLASPDDTAAQMTASSITPSAWGNFLCSLFDLWVRHDVGHRFVQLFDATLANWCGVEPGLCALSVHCGQAAVMEANGDVYSCDHFVFHDYRLGNMRERPLVAMLYGEAQHSFGQRKELALPSCCKKCSFLFACHGECPKNRFDVSADGERGLNYLCEGYRRFFRHVQPFMDYMRSEWRAGQPPANVMNVAEELLACTKTGETTMHDMGH
ncbi:MAG: anaerobic sulfatase-maturation protein [Prevotella sp.]|nr:anaerobic sulfatase-maturation protein [Prevotella sp.]